MKRLTLLLMLLIAVVGAGHSQEAVKSPSDTVVSAVSPGRAALRALVARADSGEGKALYQLARLHESGYDSIPADTLAALDLYRRAAERGYAPAQNHYGFMVYNGTGTTADRRKGREWMEKAAMAGDPSAANNLGWMLLQDNEIEEDAQKAAYWLAKAAEEGVPSAMAMLGDLYATGKGVERDTLRAATLYTDAIQAGMPGVQANLIDLCAEGWKSLTPERKVEQGLWYYTHGAPGVGVVLFSEAADEGDSRAMALMGDALTRAQGVGYDHDKALEYYYRAAVAGNAPAQFVIAELLEILPDSLDTLPDELRRGITPDHRDPMWWYGKAAEGGVTDAAGATRSLIGQPIRTTAP